MEGLSSNAFTAQPTVMEQSAATINYKKENKEKKALKHSSQPWTDAVYKIFNDIKSFNFKKCKADASKFAENHTYDLYFVGGSLISLTLYPKTFVLMTAISFLATKYFQETMPDGVMSKMMSFLPEQAQQFIAGSSRKISQSISPYINQIQSDSSKKANKVGLIQAGLAAGGAIAGITISGFYAEASLKARLVSPLLAGSAAGYTLYQVFKPYMSSISFQNLSSRVND